MDMNMGSSSTSSSNTTHMTMDMVFMNARNTPLFSYAWTPSSTAGYAFTCIFLIVLSAILRGLLAAKHLMEVRWKRQALARGFVVTADAPRYTKVDEESKIAMAAEEVVHRKGSTDHSVEEGGWNRPWRLSVDLPRACMTGLIVGVGYLLMLAVMTMNVGYFMSVIAGAFLGELFIGRFAQSAEPMRKTA